MSSAIFRAAPNILLADFDQDAEDPVMIGQTQKAFRVGDGGEPRLDSDPALPQQFHHGRRVGF